mgnify:CR=1 FL=1
MLLQNHFFDIWPREPFFRVYFNPQKACLYFARYEPLIMSSWSHNYPHLCVLGLFICVFMTLALFTFLVRFIFATLLWYLRAKIKQYVIISGRRCTGCKFCSRKKMHFAMRPCNAMHCNEVTVFRRCGGSATTKDWNNGTAVEMTYFCSYTLKMTVLDIAR